MNCVLIYAFSLFLGNNAGVLVVKVANVQENKGCIRMAIYKDEKSFLSENQSLQAGVLLPKPDVEPAFHTHALPYGHYAVAIYHDVNNNGKLDKNALGIPTEPYAFSNNPKVKWRSPRFGETAFFFGEGQKEITVALKRWSAN